jgi:hypothetical protein
MGLLTNTNSFVAPAWRLLSHKGGVIVVFMLRRKGLFRSVLNVAGTMGCTILALP